MANFAYTKFKFEIGNGLTMSSTDFRVILVMTTSTAGTEEDTDFISGFTTLDEYDGANYARDDIGTISWTRDNTNDLAFLNGDDSVFTNLGAGTTNCIGAIVYVHVTNDADSWPAFWVDTGGFPFNGTGSNNTIQWNSGGIAQVT